MNEKTHSLTRRVQGVLPLLCYAVAGVALGYGIHRARASYQSHERVVTFAARNVHHGDFAKLLSRAGHGHPVMVTLAGCPHCRDARQWLKPRHIQVTELAYGSNKAVAAVRAKYHAFGTPTLITNSELVYGFEPAAWSAALVH